MWVGLQMLVRLLVVLTIPAGLVWAGSRRTMQRMLVPRGAPPRVVTALAAVAMFVAIWAVVNSGGGDSGDNAWLILLPGLWALGLAGLAFVVTTVLWPERVRAAFTSGVILAVLVLGGLNIVLLGGWALSDEEDLGGEPIRPPVIRVIGAIAGAMVIAVVAGQVGRGSGGAEPGLPPSRDLHVGKS